MISKANKNLKEKKKNLKSSLLKMKLFSHSFYFFKKNESFS